MIDKKELRKLCDEATPGPWMYNSHYEVIQDMQDKQLNAVARKGNAPENWSNMAFIAAARSAIPALLDEIDRLNKAGGELLRKNMRLQDLSRWRSVEDELPEDGTNVLVYRNMRNAENEVAYFVFDDNGKGQFTFGDGGRYCSVTHWQPLPEPPKENK